MRIHQSVTLLTTLAMTGCFQTISPASGEPERALQDAAVDAAPDIAEVDASARNDGTRNSASIVDPNLEGEVGSIHVDAVDGESCWVHQSNSIESRAPLRVDIRCRTAAGVLMNRLEIQNWRQLQLDTPNRSGDGAGELSVLGCSGPRENDWVTDKRTSEVSVFAIRNASADMLTVSFVAEFDDGSGDVTAGSFTLPY